MHISNSFVIELFLECCKYRSRDYKFDSCGKKSSELCFLDILSTNEHFYHYSCVIIIVIIIIIINIIIIIIIIVIIIINVLIIAVFIFVSKYLYHSFETLLLLSLLLFNGKIR